MNPQQFLRASSDPKQTVTAVRWQLCNGHSEKNTKFEKSSINVKFKW